MTAESPLAQATMLIENGQARFLGRRQWLKIAARTPEYMALRRPGRSQPASSTGRKYRRATIEFWRLAPGPAGTWEGHMVMEVPLR